MSQARRFASLIVSIGMVVAASATMVAPVAAAAHTPAGAIAGSVSKPNPGPQSPIAAPRSIGKGTRVGNAAQPAPGLAPPMITSAQAQQRLRAAVSKGNVTQAQPSPALAAHGRLLNAPGHPKVAPGATAQATVNLKPLAFPAPAAGSRIGPGPQFPSGFGPVKQVFTYTGCSIFGANEPDIVQSSNNPDLIVAVVQAYQSQAGGCGDGHAFYATSHDAGLHWTQGGFPGAFNDGASGDVNVTFDPVHNVFVATWLEFTRDGAGNAIAPGRLAAEVSGDGLSWGSDVTLASDSSTVFIDKEWITTQQNPSGAFYGRVVITWTNYGPGGQFFFDAYTDNGGASWSFGSTSINFSSANCGNGTAPAFDANGDLMVAWWSCSGGRFLMEEVSPDGGANWPASSDTTITGINDTRDSGGGGTCLMNNGGTAFRCNSFPSLAGDPNSSDAGGTAWVIAWASNDSITSGGVTANLSMIHGLATTNGGATWNAGGFAFNYMNFTDLGDKFFPGLSFANNGRLEMTYSNRNASSSAGNPNGTSYNQWETEASSLASFLATSYITYQQDSTLNNPGGSQFIGDYSAQSSHDNNFDTLPIYTVISGGVNVVDMRDLCFFDCYTVLGPNSPLFVNHGAGTSFTDLYNVNLDPAYGGAGNNFWNAVGIREGSDGTSADDDTILYGDRYFSSSLSSSGFSPPLNDYTVINANSGSAPNTQYFPQVHSFSSLGSFYTIEWAYGHSIVSNPLADGMGSGNVVRVYDSFLGSGTLYYFGLRPAGGNTSDYSLVLHSASNGSEQGRPNRVADSGDIAPGQPAFISFNTGALLGQWDGLVVMNNNGGSGSYTLYRDTVVPTGTISINGGAVFTNTQAVNLTLSSSNATALDPVADMSFSNDGVNYGPWMPVASSASYTLPAGDGSHTVFVEYRNAAGGVSAAASSSISLDTTPPSTTASLTATSTGCGVFYSPVQVTLNPSDSGSGVSSTVYQLDGGAITPYAGPFSVTSIGGHTVVFHSTDNVGNIESNQTSTFTIANITLTDSPSSGSFGKVITVGGSNYIASETIKVYLDSTASSALVTTTANSACTFSTTFAVPDAVTGLHHLIAVGQTSGKSATVSFTIKAAVTLTKSSGAQGSSQTAKGHGYALGQAVVVHWGTPTGPILGTATANSLGAWTLGFVVPVKPAGTYQVIGLGQPSGPSAQKAFKITPTLKINPTQGARGSTATISFTGFGAGETVKIKWDCSTLGCASGTILATVVANANGNASGITVTIPAATTIATHMIGGVGSAFNFAKATYKTTS